MGKPTGFLEFSRGKVAYRPVAERLKDFKLVQGDWNDDETRRQGARCMDCGVPFCNNACPLGNIIPDWNDLVFRGKWEDALARLESTNNFPEVTGLVCPAPCEAACVLGINADPVTIKQIEWQIVERAWQSGWIRPRSITHESGKSVAIVGSGPAGLAAAQQLRRAGHAVTVFEKNDRIGGLLRYGIPEFKLEKSVLDRRLQQLVAEGVQLRTGVHVGVDLSASELQARFDAVLLCMGSERPRDLPVPGRELKGIHFAMDFLRQQNRRDHGDRIPSGEEILATGRHVVVIGGGDTGSDCVGTSHRQGARSVTSLEVLERPPEKRAEATPWPEWPLMYRSSSSHEEGGEREYAVLTQRFEGVEGRVVALHAVRVRSESSKASPRPEMVEIPGSGFRMDADLVLLAMGFVHPVHEGLVDALGIEKDVRGNLKADAYRFETNRRGVFAAGDCRRGQSLVVWAISEGREAARAVDRYLQGGSSLQSKAAFV